MSDHERECEHELHRLAKELGLPDDGPQENVDGALSRNRELEAGLRRMLHDPECDYQAIAWDLLATTPPPDSEPTKEETWDYGVLEALDDIDDLVKFALESPRFCVDNPSSIRNPHRLADNIRRALSEPAGEVVVTTNERGDAVAVTRQDEEGEILSVIWERGGEPAVPESVYQSATKGRADFRAALRQERDKLKAVRRLPEHWRRACSHWQCAPGADSRERTLLTCADELDRALAQRGEQGRVPEGWKLVPVEPTEEMMEQYRHAFVSSDRFDGASVYKAMIAAAPQPQEGESDE